ncbi:MAG: IS66 family insertion sequence element accessory protein TnpA [Bacillota bacterium]
MEQSNRNQEWTERIANYQSSGLTMAAWCAEHHVTLHQLKYWLRKLSPRSRKSKASPRQSVVLCGIFFLFRFRRAGR